MKIRGTARSVYPANRTLTLKRVFELYYNAVKYEKAQSRKTNKTAKKGFRAIAKLLNS